MAKYRRLDYLPKKLTSARKTLMTSHPVSVDMAGRSHNKNTEEAKKGGEKDKVIGRQTEVFKQAKIQSAAHISSCQ